MSIKAVKFKPHLYFFLFLTLFISVGCAAPASGVKVEKINGHKAVKEAEVTPAVNFVESVSVVGGGDAIMIETTSTVKYTVFKLKGPDRVIVDIPDVDVSKIGGTTSINNPYIEDIIASGYVVAGKEIGRIEIGLKGGVEHRVKSGENSILVNLKKEGIASTAYNPCSVKRANPCAVATKSANPCATKKALSKKAEKRAAKKAAKQITSLTSIESAGGVVTVKADGLIGSYNTFGFEDQGSIIVDIWGVKSAVGSKTVAIDNPLLNEVTIGSHGDKVRLVFNSRSGVMPEYGVKKSGNSLLLTISEPPPLEAVTPEVGPGVLTVSAVEFETVGDRGLLTVTSSDKPRYSLKRSLDGKIITIDLLSSVIPNDLVRTMDTSALETTVESVSSYQLAGDPANEVRILVRLSQSGEYSVLEDGNSISLDFSAASAQMAAPAMAVPTTDDAIVITKNVEPLAQAASFGEAVGIKDGEDEAGESNPEIDPYLEALEKELTKEYHGQPIDLDMVDAGIADILKLLAEISDLNIIASDDIGGTVTMRLKNVPWDQAFDIILQSKALGKIQIGNVIRVAPISVLRSEREEALAALKAKEKVEPLHVKYLQVNYEEATTLEVLIREVLTDRGTVTSHESTNTLIVKDTIAGIKEAVQVVQKLDMIIPQVLIEARIVEAESSFARDIGIQWGVDYLSQWNQTHSGLFGASDHLGTTMLDPSVQSGITDGEAEEGVNNLAKTDWPAKAGVTNYAVNLPATGTAGSLGALGFILGTAGANPMILDMRLSAGEQAGLLKTISRPRVTTLDNKEAKIEQGESIPFETTTALGTATTFIDANLNLTVKPQITPDGSVLLQIKASRNSIGTFRTSGGEPSINKKEAETEVLVRNGETTVIGGIIVTETTETEQGIPFFKEIPFVGWLFKAKSISDSQKELLIFITPTILAGSAEVG